MYKEIKALMAKLSEDQKDPRTLENGTHIFSITFEHIIGKGFKVRTHMQMDRMIEVIRHEIRNGNMCLIEYNYYGFTTLNDTAVHFRLTTPTADTTMEYVTVLYRKDLVKSLNCIVEEKLDELGIPELIKMCVEHDAWRVGDTNGLLQVQAE